MKHLLLFIIIITCILIIICFFSERYVNTEDNYLLPNIELKHSTQINDRGVFANKDYKKDEIIEMCPSILVKKYTPLDKVRDYIFSYNEEYDMVGFGYCSMYNHSNTNNARWSIVNENKINIIAVNDINKGDEIFISYGKLYWDTRTLEQK